MCLVNEGVVTELCQAKKAVPLVLIYCGKGSAIPLEDWVCLPRWTIGLRMDGGRQLYSGLLDCSQVLPEIRCESGVAV
jgi:hypothetical protein